LGKWELSPAECEAMASKGGTEMIRRQQREYEERLEEELEARFCSPY